MAIFLMHLHNVLRIHQQPCETFEEPHRIWRLHFRKMFSPVEILVFDLQWIVRIWRRGKKAPASLKNVFLSFLDNTAQDPIWFPYPGVILTVVWWWQWSKEAEWAVGAGPETRLEMWPCFQYAAASAQVPSSLSSLLPDSELRKPGEAFLSQLSCALKFSMGCKLDWVLWNFKFQERQTTPEDRLRKY